MTTHLSCSAGMLIGDWRRLTSQWASSSGIRLLYVCVTGNTTGVECMTSLFNTHDTAGVEEVHPGGRNRTGPPCDSYPCPSRICKAFRSCDQRRPFGDRGGAAGNRPGGRGGDDCDGGEVLHPDEDARCCVDH